MKTRKRTHCDKPATSASQSADPLLSADRYPIGIPALFLADSLARGLTPDQVLNWKTGLLTEYAGAEGYTYSWGHLAEQHFGTFVLWRVVPVAMWERLAEARRESRLFIWDLLTGFQPMVRESLEPELPPGLKITGCQGASRRSPHALFSLLLVEPPAIEAARQWLSGVFLHELLPTLLTAVERHASGLLHSQRSNTGD